MNKQEYNRLAAELCDVDECLVTKDGLIPVRSGTRKPFNPYDDANDMLLLEKKLKINTHNLSAVDGGVICYSFLSVGIGFYSKTGKTPHESRRSCAEEYLKEWKK